MLKKAIILEHGGGELSNQLWNYASIYAFALEQKAELKNPSFFEYHSFFTMLLHESVFTQMRSTPFQSPRRTRRTDPLNRFGRWKYSLVSKAIAMMHSACIISSKNMTNEVTYLPPTSELMNEQVKTCETLYFTGWLFRNPEGLKKYRQEILEYFQPTQRVSDTIDSFMIEVSRKFPHIVGVHIRQADYQTFKDGKYWVEQSKVRKILEEYIAFSGKDAKDVCFVITSDGSVDEGVFKGLNISVSGMNAVEDLFLLSRTEAIIGSDSSFGDFAAWLGNIPHIVFKNEPVDWEYYKDKKNFFDNKYLTLLAR